MELKWLEDFASIVETRSFSRSAQLRHVSQPAFSRRIRALENWLGADLIDRTSYPTKLTRAGETFHSEALAVMAALHAARAQFRGGAKQATEPVRFALPHTLALTFFPKWLAGLEERLGAVPCRLIATNVHDAVMAMVDGNCDLLVCYHHPRHPLQLDVADYEMLKLGEETLLPYVMPDSRGRARHTLNQKRPEPLPYLAYAPNAYLSRMADVILEDATRRGTPPVLDKVYETDMSEGLKAMALEGHGIAFLPASAVARECAQGLLVPAGSKSWSTTMEIRLYCKRLTRQGVKQGTANPLIERLWQHLE